MKYLTVVQQNDDSCGTGSQVVWRTTRNDYYYIFVTGYGGSTGSMYLTVEEGSFLNQNTVTILQVETKDHATCLQALEVESLPYIHSDSTQYIADSMSACLDIDRPGFIFL